MRVIQCQRPSSEIGPKSCAHCVRWFGSPHALPMEEAWCAKTHTRSHAADSCRQFEPRAGERRSTRGIPLETSDHEAPKRTCPQCGRTGRFLAVSIGGRKLCDTCARLRFPVRRDVQTGIVGTTPGFGHIAPEQGGGSEQAQANAKRRRAR